METVDTTYGPDGQITARRTTSTVPQYGRPEPDAVVPLELPTADGLPSVTHPDVVYVPDGWNGYRYWMAYTPYPDANREDPHVVASNNGVNWEIPTGGSNPIDTAADAQVAFFSDTDLLLIDGTTLRVYYRAGGGLTYFKDSTDGVTWTTRTQCTFTNGPGGGGGRYLSPAVVAEADGTFTMWVVDSNYTPNTMYRMTSADGATWAGWQACTVPTFVDGSAPWHTQVVYTAGRYHALIQSTIPYRLYYLTSADGVTWVGDPTPAVGRTGLPLDANKDAHYRSAMVPKPGMPLRWDLWVTGIDNSNDSANSAVWRIFLMRDVVLGHQQPADPRASKLAAAVGLDRIFLHDTFHRPDSSTSLGFTDSGQAWTARSGTWGIENGQARVFSGSSAVATVDTASGEIDVEVDMLIGGSHAALVFRAANASNFLMANLIPGSSILRIQKMEAGAASNLAASGSFSIPTSTWQRVRVIAFDDTVDVLVNGILRVSHTLTAGDLTTFGSNVGVGLRAFGGSERFKNLVSRITA